MAQSYFSHAREAIRAAAESRQECAGFTRRARADAETKAATLKAITESRELMGDVAGRNLPDQFSPWRQIGSVASGNAPPYISGDTIEEAISAHGFQLWARQTKDGEAGIKLAGSA